MVMSCRAMAGSILAGWALDTWRNRPRRWSLEGVWPVSQTLCRTTSRARLLRLVRPWRTGDDRWWALVGSGIDASSGQDEQVVVDPQVTAACQPDAGRRLVVGGVRLGRRCADVE